MRRMELCYRRRIDLQWGNFGVTFVSIFHRSNSSVFSIFDPHLKLLLNYQQRTRPRNIRNHLSWTMRTTLSHNSSMPPHPLPFLLLQHNPQHQNHCHKYKDGQSQNEEARSVHRERAVLAERGKCGVISWLTVHRAAIAGMMKWIVSCR